MITIIKALDIDKDYVKIPNILAQNEFLTYEAKGLLLELLSRPDDWITRKSQLKRGHTKESKINRIVKELRTNGYMYLHDIRNNSTKTIENRIWFVSYMPLTKMQFKYYIQELEKNKELKKIIQNINGLKV